MTKDDRISDFINLSLLPDISALIIYFKNILCRVVAGFCMFVLSLVKKHYRLQFYMVSVSRLPPDLQPRGCWVIDGAPGKETAPQVREEVGQGSLK